MGTNATETTEHRSARDGGGYPPAAERSPASVVRAGARGAIGAMAMTGLRQVSTTLGLVGSTPPESMMARLMPRVVRSVPRPRRPALVELAHWAYGTAGGVMYGMLPSSVRRRPWAGPLYGVFIWGAFQIGIAPMLGLPHRKSGWAESGALLADHLVYGMVVGASPWPSRD